MDPELNVYLDGEVVPASEATVSVFDHSFLYGDGVFEGIRVYGDRVFKLDDHLDRLYDSAAALEIDVGMTKGAFREAIVETLRGNPDGVTYLRPIVSRGSGPLGIENTKVIDDPTVVIIPQRRSPKFTEGDDGLELTVVSTRRTPFEHLESRIKSNNYLNNILGKLEVFETEADDGVMLDRDGYVAELCARNLFCVSDEAVRTPPVHNVLNGITRQTVLELAAELGYETREERLTPHDFYTADEAFVTSTMSEVAWIKSFAGREVGDGEMGPVTRDLFREYRELTETEGYEWR